MQPRAPFGGLVLLLCSLGSCTDRSQPRPPETPTAVVAVPPSPAPVFADAGTPAVDAKTVSGSNPSLELLEDGTLAVTTDKEVVTVDGAGTVRHAPIPKGKRAQLVSAFHGAGIVPTA